MAEPKLQCPRCPLLVWVSDEDPDASLSEMHRHILRAHAAMDQQAAYRLLAEAKEIR